MYSRYKWIFLTINIKKNNNINKNNKKLTIITINNNNNQNKNYKNNNNYNSDTAILTNSIIDWLSLRLELLLLLLLLLSPPNFLFDELAEERVKTFWRCNSIVLWQIFKAVRKSPTTLIIILNKNDNNLFLYF